MRRTATESGSRTKDVSVYEQSPSANLDALTETRASAPVRLMRWLVAIGAAFALASAGVLLSIKVLTLVNPYITGVLAIAMFCTGLLHAGRTDGLLVYLDGSKTVTRAAWAAFASAVFGGTLFLCLAVYRP